MSKRTNVIVRDSIGRIIRVGDWVRIQGVPDVTGMCESAANESMPVFRHIVGSYRRVSDVTAHGLVELTFRIRRGPAAG